MFFETLERALTKGGDNMKKLLISSFVLVALLGTGTVYAQSASPTATPTPAASSMPAGAPSTGMAN